MNARMTYYPGQLQGRNYWFTNPAAPVISPFGGSFPSATSATLTSANGGTVRRSHFNTLSFSHPLLSLQIYYRLDGQDPRDIGGAVNSLAQTTSGSVSISAPGRLCSRVQVGTTWRSANPFLYLPRLSYLYSLCLVPSNAQTSSWTALSL